MAKTWDSSENWYTSCVGEKGHYYHQAVVLPQLKKWIKKKGSILDLGCGQGVLARFLPKEVDYLGVDLSEKLIQSAKKLTPKRTFLKADASKELPVEKIDFDQAIFLLSLQNMEHGQKAIENAAKHLKKGGDLIIILNHPCFRIPRQSGWEIDEAKKLQYRRVDTYMSEQKIPILTHPSQREKSMSTYSYHNPLSVYAKWLFPSFAITAIEEWCSDKISEGKKAKMENRARLEIPLFLAIRAKKG